MPYNFNEYAAWCEEMEPYKLQEEYQKYVRLTTGGSTACVVGIGLVFFTFGVSAIIGSAVGMATVPNAAAKVQIIKDEMARRKKKNQLIVRKRDIFEGLALGSLGLITDPVGHHAM